ncbi:hypothetical protein J3E69DRAFT_322089 [Trichoderma sp. SZMC 28015]
MARSIALLALSGATMGAQSTTVSLLLPAADPQKLVGSVIGVDSAATTYAYGCAPEQPADKCGFESSQTITQGPTTWIYTNTYGDDEGGRYTEGGHCKLSSAADVASCTMSMSATDSTGSIIAIVTSVGTASDFLSFQLPVTITAGLEKLQAAPGASATDSSAAAAPTNSNTSASETSQTTAASSGATTSKSASSGPASTASSSSGGSTTLARQTTAAVSTGNSTSSTTATTAAPGSTNAAGFVNAQNGLLAGVAALVGGVMML